MENCVYIYAYVAWPKSKELSWKILWKSVKVFGCNCERDGKIPNGWLCLPNGRPETNILTVPGYILEVTLYIKSNNLTKTNSHYNYNARFKDLFAE